MKALDVASQVLRSGFGSARSANARLFLLAAFTLAACSRGASDVDSGPRFADEAAALDAVRAVYRGWGIDDPVTLELGEDVLIPYASRGTVHMWPFIGPRSTSATHVATIDRLLYGGRLADWKARFPTPEDADRGLEAFLIAAIGHEVAHVVANAQGVSHIEEDPWAEETRAIRFEWAVLNELVARDAVPRRILDDYRAFNRVLLDAAPSGMAETLPKDDAARRVRFNAGYGFVSSGEIAGHEPAIDAVLALYTTYRLELAAGAPESAQVLLQSLAPARDPVASAARRFLRRMDLPFEHLGDGGLTTGIKGMDPRLRLRLEPREGPADIGVMMTLDVELGEPLSDLRKGAVGVVLGRAQREDESVVFELVADGPVVRCKTFAPGGPDALSTELPLAMARLMNRVARWINAVADVAGGADPSRVQPAASGVP